MAHQPVVEIVAFTDPVCTWCWGSEPLLRKLLAWYGDQIRITPVMGELVEDIRAFYDSANRIGGDLAPKFYPGLSSFGRLDVPIWAVAGAGAELST